MNLEKLEHYTIGFSSDLEDAIEDKNIPSELKISIMKAQLGLLEMILYFGNEKLKAINARERR